MALPLERRLSLGHGHYRMRGVHGEPMRVARDLLKSVVFIGDRDECGFASWGTAFFLLHEGAVYLVTARHVAEARDEATFHIHFNMTDGTAKSSLIDLTEPNQRRLKWFFAEDPNVDLAVMLLHLDFPRMGIECVAIKSDASIKRVFPRSEVGCGDICYAIGLFQRHGGKGRILPAVHTGHIAMMSDSTEPIPVNDNGRELDVVGYLVELSNLPGLSGAPVFVRQGLELNVPLANEQEAVVTVSTPELKLLGVWQGSWSTPGEALGERVKLGMGIVVPAEMLLDLLNSEPTKAHRHAWVQDENQATMD